MSSPLQLSDASGTLRFHDLTFGESQSFAVWEVLDSLDVNGDLSTQQGTLNRATQTIALAGDLVVGVNSKWAGLASTTFDGTGTHTWSDATILGQDIGYALVDGAVRTVTVASDVLASSITIGANDTLNGGGTHDIQIKGNFTNNNIFVPSTSRIVITGPSANSVIKTNGSNLYAVRASSTGGTVAFFESTVTLLDNIEIATGTVTFPSDILRIGGSLQNSGGAFAHNNGEVRFNGAGTETIQLQGSAFLNALYDVRFNGTGAWSFVDTNATTSNTLTMNSGTVTFPAGQLSVAKDFITNAPGAFLANGGEVLLLAGSNDLTTTNGSVFHNIRVAEGTQLRGGDFDAAWSYRDTITIQSSQIDDDLTDFPVYLDMADFSSDFFANVNADGGDIRVTLADGLTEVPREIVAIDTGAETGEMYFKAPFLSSTTNATFYIYYGNAAASDYAIDAVNGAENVWSNDFLAVYHMNEANAIDSTSFDRDATAIGNTPTTATGRIGTAVSIADDGGDDYLDLNSNLAELNGQAEVTISSWVNVTEDSGDDVIFAQGNGDPILLWDNISGTTNDDTYTFSVGNTGTGNRVDAAPTGISVGNTWQYVSAAMESSNRYIYVDGVLRNTTTGAVGTITSNTGGSFIGRWLNSFDYGGLVDEFRISSVEREAAWVAAEYENMNAPSDFYMISSGFGIPTRIFSDAIVTATGDFVIDTATAQLPGTNFAIAGSFDNNGSFVAGPGSVTLTATTSGHVVSAGSSTFNNLTFNGAGGGWNIVENATATNAITLNTGNNLTVNNGVVLESTGTFFNNMQNASTTWTGATLKLSGGTDFTINNKLNSGDTYNILELSGDGDIKMWNSSAGTYTTNDTSSIYSQDHLAVDGDLYVFGDYERTTGTEHWSYATDFDGSSLGTSSVRQANVRVENSGSVLIATSSLNILGSATASTTVDAQSGSFAMNASFATINGQYFTFSGTDAAGLNLTASTTVNTFADFTFTIPPVSSAITVDASTIDTNPGRQFFNTNFVSGGGNVNVTLAGSPASFWWFRDGQGNRYGEAFDNGDGDPGSIRWDDSSYNIAISGTVYADDGTVTLGGPTCDGTTQNVRIVVDGGVYASSTSCSGIDGSYTFPAVAYVGDPSIIVYLDTNGGEVGSVVTKTPTADITDMDIYANRVIVRHEDTSPLTIADMLSFDETNDSDVQFVAATGTPDTLITRPETELLVFTGKTFTPNGEITLQSGGSGAAYDGSLHVDNGATFTATGTQTHSIGGSFFNDELSAFNAASSTLLFTATTSGKGITQLSGETLSFNELEFTGVGGSWNLAADVEVAQDMTINAGTVTGTGDITVTSGELTGAGLLSMGGGTTTINQTNTLGGVQGWTFFDLVLGDGAVAGTTTRANTATTTISGTLVINPGHFLDAGASVWNLSGVGEVFVENGTLLQDTSTFVYSGPGTAEVLSTNYYNLQFGGAAGAPQYTFDTVGFVIENDLLVGGSVASEVDLNTNDPVILVAGDVSVIENGNLSLSSSAEFTVSGSYDNNATLTANGGTIVFDSADSYTIAAGASDFAGVRLEGAGAVTIIENATSTGLFLIATSSDFTQQTGTTLAVGGQLTIQSGTTDWTGSTLSLYGGGDYLVNQKDISEDYENLQIAAGTEIRTWNSSAVTQTVDPTGSWYSQDHAGVDGDLYVFGAYSEGSRNDYWNYATDFDGADLTGLERQVNVYLAENASALWTGGSISVIGTSSATTTIQNQGAGTYGLTVAGNTTADWQYLSIRDIDSDGLTFSGSPSVSDFANADLLVEQNGGSAITVGATAITASPARTLSDIIFNSAGGVTGAVNVTATGTTLSGWRFTAHSGNLDGEANDSDPAGDPGYIIWDDSAAIISISGNVYEADGVTVSSVCDDATTNIVLAVKGSLAQNASSSCASADGSYIISGVSFGSLDELMIYIDGEPADGVMVTKDPISSIADADIYENHVIVRHENVNPLTIANMAIWDSSDDSDIPYTAINAGTDTLSLPADTKLLIWANKDFAPAGNITLAGGGAGASYDGSLEALSGAQFIAAGNESHSIGGSFEFASDASFVAASSTVTFTTNGVGRSVKVNEDDFNNLVFNGSGSWSIVDAGSTVLGDLTITSGALTLAAATTTVGGSLTNSASLNTNNGQLRFTAGSGTQTVTFGGDDAAEVVFTGGANWTITDTNATATGAFTVAAGLVTLPSGVLSVGEDFVVTDTVLHNSGTVQLTRATGNTTLTLSGNDLFTVLQTGAASTTMTDGSAAFLGDLEVLAGEFKVATNTLSIGGSLQTVSAVLDTASGTLLFNSNDTGETVNVGNNDLYNVVFANALGGWTLSSATTTNNFTITTANDFTLLTGNTLTVGGVFQNLVGGAATTWSNTTLRLIGANAYSINNKSTAGDIYENLVVGANSDIRVWNSVASSTVVDPTSSLYSQDHAASNGVLNIYGDFSIGTTTEYWSYATDFDGSPLSGINRRAVSVQLAENATTTLRAAGTLQVLGASGFPTLVRNQGSGNYSLNVTGGTLALQYYSLANMTDAGLNISGTPTISSLSNGEYLVGNNSGRGISLARTALDANPSFLILDTTFATVTPATTGINVDLSATSTNSWTFRNEMGGIAGEFYDVDGVSNCGSIRWDDSSCLLTEQTEYRWRNDDGGLGVPDSEWFDEDWSKRKRLRVANNDNTPYTNAAVLVTIDYDADMQNDFDDLRFTAADGVTQVDFWIERFTPSVSADVWVEVPTLPGGETVSLFFYYDNIAAASESSAEDTLIAVDDFEDNDLLEYSGQTSLFQVDTGSAFGGVYGLELKPANKGTRLNPGIARFDQTVSQGETIRFKQYVNTTAGASDEVCTLFGVQSPASANQNYGVCLEQFGTDRITLAKNILSTDNFGTVVPLASSTVTYTTGWYEVEIDWLTNNTMNVFLYNPSGTLVATVSATDSTYTSGGYGFTSWGQNGDWDSYLSRPLLTTEPSTFFGVEQTRGGATYAAAQNTPTSNFTVGDTARLRVAIENTGLDIVGQEFQIEYAARGAAASCAAVDGAEYTAVPATASCGGSAICMSSSATVANDVATTDLLKVDRNTFAAGTFVEDPSNQTPATNLNQNRYTELEYALEVTTDAVDQSYCFRVTDDGAAYDSYVNIPELTLKFDPVVGAISLNSGADISLLPGTTTPVFATGTVTDFNGVADLAFATSTIYRSGVLGGAACAPDNNDCYVSSCEFVSCSGSSCEVQCRADIFFHADPTDADAFEGQEWLAFVEVEDQSEGYDFGSAPGVELSTLRAIDVVGAIDYGALEVNANTGSFNASTSIFNFGNVEADIEITGTDLSDGASSIIPAEQQKFATTTFNYSGCVGCALLSDSAPVELDIDLSKPAVDTPPVTDEVYWGIEIPFGVNSVPHQGINVFTPISP